ncbi:MAG: helix-turn-helix domain-containing protein [Methylococcales bacterium]|jgi:CRP/FNR family transcriptional regulator|nr:helix-turn-helix domain-containing protein [Methylococcales bacterium]
MNSVLANLKIDCTNCRLQNLCLPRGLSKQDIQSLSDLVQNDTLVHKGDFIYRQGDDFYGLIAINAGSAKMLSTDSEGNQDLTNLVLPGELIGFDGVSTNTHQCSAIALETVNYCKINPDKLDVLCNQFPSLLRELFSHSCEAINESQRNPSHKNQSANKKLAQFLLTLSNRLMSRGFSSTEFNLTLNRQDLALHLSLTPETVSRLFSKLHKQKIISVSGKNIQITNLEKLKIVASE